MDSQGHPRKSKERAIDKHRHRDKDRNDSGENSSKRKEGGRKKDKKRTSGSRVVNDNQEDEENEIWVEKGPDGEVGEASSIASIPTNASLSLVSHATPSSHGPLLPHSTVSESLPRERRDEWMLGGDVNRQAAPVLRQSDNLHNGGTFSVGEIPTGIARPSLHNSIEEFTEGYGDGEVGTKGSFGGDFFSDLGRERRKKKALSPKNNGTRNHSDQPKMSAREINTGIYAADGTRLPSSLEAIDHAPSSHLSSVEATRAPAPGSSGSNWRMMKLRRTYEAAKDEGKSVEDMGVERFGSIEVWEAAKNERRILDERTTVSSHSQGRSEQQQKRDIGGRSRTRTDDTDQDDGLDEFGRDKRRDGSPPADPPSASRTAGRYIFTEPSSTASSSRSISRTASFRKPGNSVTDLQTDSPFSSSSSRPQPLLSYQNREPSLSKPSTPIPSVFTPPLPTGRPNAAVRKPTQLQESPTAQHASINGMFDPIANEDALSQPLLSPTSLNKLQAKILRVRLMGSDLEGLKRMEETYERELLRSRQGDAGQGYFNAANMGTFGAGETEVRVLPTLDGRGRLYDVGRGTEDVGEDEKVGPGAKRKRKEKYFETRDTATGELLRYNADDDTTSLEEMVRQERFGAGSRDQKDMDTEMASRIAGDAKYEDDLDYMDDSADRLARKKIKTEAQKKMFAINDFAKTKKVLDTCSFCYQDTETTTIPPTAPMVALGLRAYLSLPLFEPLVEGHAIIVPIQHHLCTLEADDDTWDEMKNFMKTLMQMHAEQDKGVFFYETIISFKGQRHTYIEAIPLPWEQFEEMPAYFREGILTSEAEWSQHRKLIDFSARPGGFRRAMVPNLPYFMVHWDYKGEKGFGHVIEGAESATGAADGYDFDEGAKGGGEFQRNFAAEIIGSVLELEPRLWRRPRRIDRKVSQERVAAFRKGYDHYDWTKLLSQTTD